MPPPGTIIWACGWWVSVDPQVCNTAVSPMRAPRCLGSWAFSPRACPVGAIVIRVSAATLSNKFIDDGLVVIGDVGDRPRQGEDDMEIRHGQEFGLAVGQPFLGSGGLALWAMPIATGVVRDAQVGAGLAAFDMPAQRPHGTSPWAEGPRSAALERRHDLELVEAHMAGMGGTPSRPAMAEDVRHPRPTAVTTAAR